VKLLLDTHVYLWFLADDSRLPKTIKSAIEDPFNDLFLSIISAFEISIKHGLGKLPLDVSLKELLGRQLQENEIELLAIHVDHLTYFATLPIPKNGHRDPFDRLLIAQAYVEEMAVCTVDSMLYQYDVKFCM